MYQYHPGMIGMPQQQFYQPQPQVDDLKFVNGAESAMAYRMPPNSKVLLMDQGMPRFYIKQTDASGMPSIKAYDFKEAVDETPDYLTRSEFEERMARIESLVQQQQPQAKPC